MVKDMDSDDLLHYIKKNHGIKDTKGIGAAVDALVRGNYLVIKHDTVLGFQTALHKTYWMERQQYLDLPPSPCYKLITCISLGVGLYVILKGRLKERRPPGAKRDDCITKYIVQNALTNLYYYVISFRDIL